MTEKALAVYHKDSKLALHDFPSSYSVELESGVFGTSRLENGVHRLSMSKEKPKDFTLVKYFVCNEAFWNEHFHELTMISEYTIRGKWMFDGCKTVEDIVKTLKGQVRYYEKMAKDGWQLREPVEDDYGFLTMNLKYSSFTSENELKGPVYRA